MDKEHRRAGRGEHQGKLGDFMSFLDFENGKEDLKFIRSALRKRGLFMDEEDEWEVHGPHQDMNYLVYIGRVFEQPIPVYTLCTCATMGIDRCKKHVNGFYVAIYPRAVYEVQSPDDWLKVREDERIELGGRNP